MPHKIISKPAKWVSGHRKNEYNILLPQATVLGSYNSAGYLGLLINTSFSAIGIGDRVYIYDGVYQGYHVIKSIVSAIQFVTETEYQSSYSGGDLISYIDLPVISIYKGYKEGELVLPYLTGTLDMFDVLPYTLVAQFKPETNSEGLVNFDLCGYLRTVIESPYKAAYSPDEESFIYRESATTLLTPKYTNKVSVYLDLRWKIGEHMVANSAITTDELNRDFVDTDRQMQPLKVAVKLFNQFTIGDYINNDLLKAKYTF